MGAAVTEYEYEDYLERIDVFRLWFNENVMETGQESGFNTVMVLPYGIAEPKYRDARPRYVNSGTYCLAGAVC